jgi:hypothetical protein
LNAGDIQLAAAPEFARGSTTRKHPDRLRVLATMTRRRRRFGCDDAAFGGRCMFTRQHGTCAICLRMVSETLCLDHCPTAAVAHHLVCDECVARHCLTNTTRMSRGSLPPIKLAPAARMTGRTGD